jgi:hypothetical protein
VEESKLIRLHYVEPASWSCMPPASHAAFEGASKFKRAPSKPKPGGMVTIQHLMDNAVCSSSSVRLTRFNFDGWADLVAVRDLGLPRPT